MSPTAVVVVVVAVIVVVVDWRAMTWKTSHIGKVKSGQKNEQIRRTRRI